MEQGFDRYIVQQSPSYYNYGLLKTVPESRYSCLMPWHLDQVQECLLYETKNMIINKIVDTTANIGCDTILFRLLFQDAEIVSIELNPNTACILSNNMCNISNIIGKSVLDIQVENINCLDYIYDNPADLLYFDPPWGEDYKNNICNLSLSSIDLGIIINNILLSYPTLIVTKLPFNIDFNQFTYNVTYNLDNVYIKTYEIYTPSAKNPKISYLLVFIKLINNVNQTKDYFSTRPSRNKIQSSKPKNKQTWRKK